MALSNKKLILNQPKYPQHIKIRKDPDGITLPGSFH
jgi:hypothetical protein